MQSRGGLPWLAIVGLLVTGGCLRPYRQPGPNEPHAYLQVSRSYSTVWGTSATELVVLQETTELARRHGAPERNPPPMSTRVHPGHLDLEVRASFGHPERRSTRESYQKPETYLAHESYNCGSPGAYRSCTRTVTRQRSVTAWRTVDRTQFVTEHACSASTTLMAFPGHVYALHFDADGVSCRLTCVDSDPRGLQGPCQAPLDSPRKSQPAAGP